MAMDFENADFCKQALAILRKSQLSIQIGEEHRELFSKPDRPPQVRREGRLFSFLYSAVKTLLQQNSEWQPNYRLGVSRGMLYISVGEESVLELFTVRKNGEQILGLESGRHLSKVSISPEKASELIDTAWEGFCKESRDQL